MKASLQRRMLAVITAFTATVALGSFSGSALAQIDTAQSTLTATSKQMNVPVEGKFGKFSAQVSFDPAKVNINGGAIALGHPLGCTGAKLTATLLHSMQARGARYGLVTMCVGGGMGAAGIFESLN